MRVAASLLAAMTVLVAPNAIAASGKVLFASGQVSAELASAQRALQTGDGVEVGETVVTGDKSRAQLLLLDGQRIALRAASRFRIDAFSLPASVRTPGAQATAVQAAGQSLFTLQSGGLRTRTSAAGKTSPDAYQMRTPVGTLGIRGTDYTIIFCRGDCFEVAGAAAGAPARDGLYIAVDEGRIVFAGRGIEIEVGAGQTVFIALEEASPERLREPPTFMRTDGAGLFDLAGVKPRQPAANTPKLANVNDRRAPADGESAGVEQAANGFGDAAVQAFAAASAGGTVVDLTPGVLPLKRGVAYGFSTPAPGFVVGGYGAATSFAVDANGNLVRVEGPFGVSGNFLGKDLPLRLLQATLVNPPSGVLSIGTAGQADLGANAALGLRWGRWSSGAASYTPNGGTAQSIDLSQQSLPWILGPELRDAVVLPTTGTASFGLVGGTRPTGSGGTVGTLGNAFLTANFTTQSITAAVALDLGGVSWYASGNGTIGAGGFSGNFGTVTIAQVVSGGGGFSGFFTDAAAGSAVPRGAGLTYLLTDPLNQFGTVSGVAALQQGTGTAPVAPALARRNVLYATGQIGSLATVTAVTSNTTDTFTLSGSQLQRGPGVAALGLAPVSGAFDTIGRGVTITAGSDAATGLQWGRWSGGSFTALDASGAAITQSLANQSLHYILGPAFGPSPVLPTTGTRSYVLVGNTAPTDTLGRVGTLGGMVASADFTARTVATTLSLDVGGANWYAVGSGNFAAGSSQFSGSFSTVRVNGVVDGSGNLSGFFVEPAYGVATQPGLGVGFSLAEPTGSLGVVSGAAALRSGAGTAPAAPPALQRYVAYASTGLATDAGTPQRLSDIQIDAATAVTQNGTGALTRFVAETRVGGVRTDAQFDIGSATVSNAGLDAGTGIRWGRWVAGTGSVTPAGQSAVAQPYASQNLAWLLGPQYAFTPALPTTGVRAYGLAGATLPVSGTTIGALGATAFSADFGARTVATSMVIDLAGRRWYLTGSGGFVTGVSNSAPAGFGVQSASGNVGRIAAADLTLDGFFSTAQYGVAANNGAGVSYTAAAATGRTDEQRLAGVAVFSDGVAATTVTAPAGRRDIQFAFGPGPFVAQSQTASQYDLSAGFDATRFAAQVFSVGQNAFVPQTLSLGTASNVDTGFDLRPMLRWGRWTNGTAQAVDGLGATTALALTDRSLHWISSADSAAPVLPISGTQTYVLVGATSPTATLGHVGTLGGAFAAADFSTGLVDVAISLDISGHNFYGTGRGAILAGDYRFSSAFLDARRDGISGDASGQFAGFFTYQTSAGLTPQGLGLSYSFSDLTGAEPGNISGVAALLAGPGAPPVPPAASTRAYALVIRDLTHPVLNETLTLVDSGLRTPQLDGSGNLRAITSINPFILPPPIATADYALGTAVNLNTGFDAATGLRWGRWSAGNAQFTAGVANGPIPLANNSLHWVLGVPQSGPPVLPQVGQRRYGLTGATPPTDTFGNVGTLNGVSLVMDFTGQRAVLAIDASVDGRRWYGLADRPLADFSGCFCDANDQPAVIVGNLARADGFFAAFLQEAQPGFSTVNSAGISWSMGDPLVAQGGPSISGAVALGEVPLGPTLLPLPPPGLQRRDIAYSSPIAQGAALSNATGHYTLDTDLLLTSMRVNGSQPAAPSSGVFTFEHVGSEVDTDVNLQAYLRWGRWTDGQVLVRNTVGQQVNSYDLSGNSVHYIMSGDEPTAPVLPQSGSQVYQLAGATPPTVDGFAIGLLGSATLSADFTNQQVDLSLAVSFGSPPNGSQWAASGTAPLTAGSNLFTGALNGTLVQAQAPALPVSGQFTGFFSGPPTGPVGAPVGVGVSYSLLEGQSQSVLNGVLAFIQP